MFGPQRVAPAFVCGQRIVQMRAPFFQFIHCTHEAGDAARMELQERQRSARKKTCIGARDALFWCLAFIYMRNDPM